MQPFDHTLNSAILAMAGEIFPDGFDVSDDAPSSYEALIQHLNAGNRMVVYSGGAEGTIYADPQVNYAFRAWHDWCHWKGANDFTIPGEIGVYTMQVSHLKERFSDVNRWSWILYAEVVGQRLYYSRYKTYVEDQRSFIAAYLTDPHAALSRMW